MGLVDLFGNERLGLLLQFRLDLSADLIAFGHLCNSVTVLVLESVQLELETILILLLLVNASLRLLQLHLHLLLLGEGRKLHRPAPAGGPQVLGDVGEEGAV